MARAVSSSNDTLALRGTMVTSKITGTNQASSHCCDSSLTAAKIRLQQLDFVPPLAKAPRTMRVRFFIIEIPA